MTISVLIEEMDSIVKSEVIDFNKDNKRRYAMRLEIKDTDGNGVELLLSSADVALLQSLIKGA